MPDGADDGEPPKPVDGTAGCRGEVPGSGEDGCRLRAGDPGLGCGRTGMPPHNGV